MDRAYGVFLTMFNIAKRTTAPRHEAELGATSRDVADEQVAMAAFRRSIARGPSATAEDIGSFDDWSAEQRQMFEDLQDEALQLFGTNFIADRSRWIS